MLYAEGNLILMEQLLSCGTNIYLWKYGADGHLSGTNCEHLVLDKLLERTGNKSYMIEHCEKYTAPLIMGGQLGLMWCAIFERKENTATAIYVLGPVFNSEISIAKLEQSVRDFDIDRSWRQGYLNIMGNLPVVSSILFFQYALMTHYCVTGEKLNRSDLHFQQWNPTPDSNSDSNEIKRDRTQVWLTERLLLSMVREGHLDYQNAISRANMLSNGIPTGDSDPILQAIVSCTSFTSLCVREAIQAGISPDTAYRVGDSYIQSMVQCKTVTELRSINHTMYEDFIRRVHKIRQNPKVSFQIQLCKDYIETHADEPLSLEILSKQARYSEYHLSRKFKQEMGQSIRAYIRQIRIERAKFLLTSTAEPIAKIAEELQFSSSSHFSSVFQELTGEKPQKFRQKNQKVVLAE